jgi:hypothetical protein
MRFEQLAVLLEQSQLFFEQRLTVRFLDAIHLDWTPMSSSASIAELR